MKNSNDIPILNSFKHSFSWFPLKPYNPTIRQFIHGIKNQETDEDFSILDKNKV